MSSHRHHRGAPDGEDNYGYSRDRVGPQKSGNIYGDPPLSGRSRRGRMDSDEEYDEDVPKVSYRGGRIRIGSDDEDIPMRNGSDVRNGKLGSQSGKGEPATPKRIDLVLVYNDKKPEEEDDDDDRAMNLKRRDMRAKFERLMVKEGIEMQKERLDANFKIIKLHTTFKRLCKEAEKMCLELPLHGCEVYDDGPGTCWTRFEEKYLETDDEVDFISGLYKMDHHDIFEKSDDEDTFFRPALRSFITHHILINLDIRGSGKREVDAEITKQERHKEAGQDDDHSHRINALGLPYMLLKKVFTDALVLHEESAECPIMLEETEDALEAKGEKLTKQRKQEIKDEAKLKLGGMVDARDELDKAWGKFFKYQPLWKIRNYYGEKIALYFAWCGVMISSLWIPTLMGLAVFIYGMILSIRNNSNLAITSGNITDAASAISDSLDLVKLAFDNDATPIFALVICLWGTLFLEAWKRNNAALAYEWDVDNYESTEPDRPQFYGTDKCPDPVTMQETWFYPIKLQFIKFMTSCSVLVIMVLLVFISVAAVILYRVIMTIDYCGNMTSLECLIVATVASSVLNALSILLLGKVYDKLALTLTNWENHRTQTQYDDALIIKLFLFQFANCYTSLFYIAFFRGYEYEDGMFGLGANYQDTCGTVVFNSTNVNGTVSNVATYVGGNCMSMLSFQVLTVMLIKPFPKLAKDVIVPWLLGIWKKRKFCRKSKVATGDEENLAKVNDFITREYNKPQLGDMTLTEYTEKVIMYGYLMLFAASFSLAPLILLCLMVCDIRVDGKRLIWMFRRPITTIAQDIGMWYNILLFLNVCGVVSNAFLVAFTSSWGAKYDTVGKLWIVIIFENGVMALKILLKVITPDIPKHVKLSMRRNLVFALKFLLAVLIPDEPKGVGLAKRREKYQIEKIMEEVYPDRGISRMAAVSRTEMSLLGGPPSNGDLGSPKSRHRMENEEEDRQPRNRKKKNKRRKSKRDDESDLQVEDMDGSEEDTPGREYSRFDDEQEHRGRQYGRYDDEPEHRGRQYGRYDDEQEHRGRQYGRYDDDPGHRRKLSPLRTSHGRGGLSLGVQGKSLGQPLTDLGDPRYMEDSGPLSYDADGSSYFGGDMQFPNSELKKPIRDKSRLHLEPRSSRVRIALPEDVEDDDRF